MMKKSPIKRGDIIAIVAVLACAGLLALLLNSSAHNSNSVRIVCGDDVYSYSLTQDKEITLENNGITLQISISNGEVSVVDSTCRDKICVNTHGNRIVCLPAGVMITVSGGEYDFIAG